MSRKTKQFHALTGLRFVAAASVVAGHVGHIFPSSGAMAGWQYYMAIMPALGMPLFFTLSGFVIYWNYSTILDGRPVSGLWRFFVARFSRLYPLYALILLITLVHQWGFGGQPLSNTAHLLRYLTLTQTWSYDVVGDRSLIFMYGGMPSIAWSISTEWFFYLTFPALCVALSGSASVRRFVLIGIVVFVAWSAALAVVIAKLGQIDAWARTIWTTPAGGEVFSTWLIYFSPYSQLVCFILGCLTAAIVMKLSVEGKSTGWLPTWAAALFLAASVIVPWSGPRGPIINVILSTSMFVVVPAALFIFCCARYENALVRALSRPAMVRFGEASYALYLLHVPLIAAFAHNAAKTTSGAVALGDLALAVPLGFALLGASVISYEYFEMPAQRLLRKLLAPKPKAAVKPAE